VKTDGSAQSKNGAITAFAQHRQALLRHAANVMCADGFAAEAERCAPLSRVSALLASSLEALRVAEEELVQLNDSMASVVVEMEGQIAYFQRLFDLAPTPLLLTDLFGSLILANKAAVVLLKAPDAYRLLHKPIANFVPVDQRSKFRKELSRVSAAERVVDWHFTLVRRADTPIEVSAAVQIVSGVGRDGGDALQWCLRRMATDSIASTAALAAAATRSIGLVTATADRAD
jgi:PAS domain-containing protein